MLEGIKEELAAVAVETKDCKEDKKEAPKLRPPPVFVDEEEAKREKRRAKKKRYKANQKSKKAVETSAATAAAHKPSREELKERIAMRRRGMECARSNDVSSHADLAMSRLLEASKHDPRSRTEYTIRQTAVNVINKMRDSAKPAVAKRLMELSDMVRLMGLVGAAQRNRKLGSAVMNDLAERTEEAVMREMPQAVAGDLASLIPAME